MSNLIDNQKDSISDDFFSVTMTVESVVLDKVNEVVSYTNNQDEKICYDKRHLRVRCVQNGDNEKIRLVVVFSEDKDIEYLCKEMSVGSKWVFFAEFLVLFNEEDGLHSPRYKKLK